MVMEMKKLVKNLCSARAPAPADAGKTGAMVQVQVVVCNGCIHWCLAAVLGGQLSTYRCSPAHLTMAQITPIRGFASTPVSRSVCVLATVLAVAVAVFEYKHFFVLAIDPFIVDYNQYWRVVLYQLSVINESDYLLTVLLWFHFKTLERFFGSRKYLSVITLLFLYNGVLGFVAMSLGQLLVNFVLYFVSKLHLPLISLLVPVTYLVTFLNRAIPGPLGVLSSLYICYGKYIPVSYHFKVQLSASSAGLDAHDENFNDANDENVNVANGATFYANTNPISSAFLELNLTNHFQVHAIYTILFLNNGIQSIIPCMVGILVGKLFISDLLVGSNRWSVPLPVFYVFASPSKAWSRYSGMLQLRLGGYQPVRTTIEEEPEETNDDVRSSEAGIRAETPVRPLGSQFLDTFRT